MNVFVSYSHSDEKLAQSLVDTLRKRGVDVWLDEDKMKSGDLLPFRVSKAISECDCFCVLCSHKSSKSRLVRIEISAAFDRWIREPKFRIIPVAVDSDSIPTILLGMHYVEIKNKTAKDIATSIACIKEPNIPSSKGSCDWAALLSVIEKDQFSENPSSHKYGGWLKSFFEHFLPLAYPNKKPESVSSSDSVTHTWWMIRGLQSLQSILTRIDQNDDLLSRIELLQARARGYLIRHFNGRGAGLIRQTTQGEQIFPDVRHSATFARAMIALGGESSEEVSKSVEFAIKNYETGDGRLPTYAELYYVLEHNGLTPFHDFGEPISCDEKRLLRHRVDYHIRKACWTLPRTLARDIDGKKILLSHPTEDHMASFYTWWVLSSRGNELMQSEEFDVKDEIHSEEFGTRLGSPRIVLDLLLTMDSLGIENADGSISHSFTLSYSRPMRELI